MFKINTHTYHISHYHIILKNKFIIDHCVGSALCTAKIIPSEKVCRLLFAKTFVPSTYLVNHKP